jgi:hypothetical protein
LRPRGATSDPDGRGHRAGTRRGLRSRDPFVVELDPFEPLDEAVPDGVEPEVVDVDRFLGREVVLDAA